MHEVWFVLLDGQRANFADDADPRIGEFIPGGQQAVQPVWNRRGASYRLPGASRAAGNAPNGPALGSEGDEVDLDHPVRRVGSCATGQVRVDRDREGLANRGQQGHRQAAMKRRSGPRVLPERLGDAGRGSFEARRKA